MTGDAADGAVGPAGLERALAQFAADDPDAGLFGPGSALWRVDREAALFLGSGRALLLQLAHPWVAAAIAAHSDALADPFGRFHRTFGTVYVMVFGTRAQALGVARRLHRVHAGITGRMPHDLGAFAAGSGYRANEVEALRWVWATLVDSALLAHDLALPPLAEGEAARYYADGVRIAGLFGLSRDDVPPDRAAFAAYMAGMVAGDVLAVGPDARRIGLGLLTRPKPWLPLPRWFRDLTAHTLPPRLREAYGLPHGPAQRRRAERAIRLIRRAYPLLPRRLRHVGPYQEAVSRLAGRGPDLPTRALNRAWIGRARLGG